MELWRSEWERLRMQQAQEEGETFDPDASVTETSEDSEEATQE